MDVTRDWFDVRELDTGIYLIHEPGHVQSFLVNGDTTSLFIDTGMGFRNILDPVRHLLNPRMMAANTHWHFDHIGGNPLFTEVLISQSEACKIKPDIPNTLLFPLYIEACIAENIPLPHGFNPLAYAIEGSTATGALRNGQEIDLGNRILEVIATPGHTLGSVSFYDPLTRSLFAGDTIYQGPLYAQFTDSSLGHYHDSIEKLVNRKGDFERIYAGHNEPCLPPSILDHALDALTKILKGQVLPRPDNWAGHPCTAYDFQRLRVLCPAPGTDGIDLF